MKIKVAPIDALDSKAIVPIRRRWYRDYTGGTFESRDRAFTFNRIDWVVDRTVQSYRLVGWQVHLIVSHSCTKGSIVKLVRS